MRRLGISVAVLCLLAPMTEAAEVMHLPWEDLGIVTGKTVRIFLGSGFLIGKATLVEADALVVDLTKTSDPANYPKGRVRVPRTKLHRFEIQTKGKLYRYLFTAAGGWLGSGAGFFAMYGVEGCNIFSTCSHSAGGVATMLGVTGAVAAAGYAAGNVEDRHWTAIEIVP
jgi:hypothetical protein